MDNKRPIAQSASRSRWRRRIVAIAGMIFAMVMAYALLMQEQEKLFRIDHEGRIHFVWVRRVLKHKPPHRHSNPTATPG
jgi:hypothetical protein